MTIAKETHKQARRLLIEHLDMHPGTSAYPDDLDPAEVGIVGGPSHVATGTSYHLGKDQLQLSKRPYSVYESARDQRGLNNYASAMDIGWFTVTTSRGTFDLRHFSLWLVGLCKAGDPDTVDIREVIYSPDGKVVKRFDDLGIRSSGDSSHLTHTHVSEYRDATGARVVRLVTRYLTEIGLLEDDMQLTDVVPAAATADKPNRNVNDVLGDVWRGVHIRVPASLAAMEAREVARDAAQTELIRQVLAAAGNPLSAEQFDRALQAIREAGRAAGEAATAALQDRLAAAAKAEADALAQG